MAEIVSTCPLMTPSPLSLARIRMSKHREEHADNTSGLGKQVSRKRWYKENLYLWLPLFLRCMLYYQSTDRSSS
jgi:hypothetical protein